MFHFFMNTSHNLWNLKLFLGELEKNPYKAWRRALKQTTKANFDKTNIAKLI
jgi:hypothetical protein